MKTLTPISIIIFVAVTNIMAQDKKTRKGLKTPIVEAILPSFKYFEKSKYRLFYHTIKPDESLASIAQQYNLPLADVKAMNNLRSDATPAVGQELLLEDRSQGQKVVTAAVMQPTLARATPSVETHILPPATIVLNEVTDKIDENKLKVLQIESKEVAQPELVHFIETEDIERYQKQAAQEGKLLFVNYYADWCIPCKMMQESVFKDQDVAVLMNKSYLSLHINGDTENGKLLRLSQAVTVFPTLLVLDKNGDEIARKEGALGIEAFKDFIKNALEKTTKVIRSAK